MASPATETGPSLHDLIRGGRSFSGRERNCCFLNLRDGSFGNVSAVSGLDLPDDGRAIARVDWDSDGDLDLWIANRNGPQLRFLQNTTSRRGGFIQFQLAGETCNRDAIGARIELVETAGAPPQLQTVTAGDGFLAQSTKLVHFGLGSRDPEEATHHKVEKVIVRWPDGPVETFTGLEIGQRYRIHQGRGTPERIKAARETKLNAENWGETAASGTTRVVSVAGLPLPEFEFIELSARKPQLVTQRHGAVLLNLWSTRCQPCLAELDEWAKSTEVLRDAGLEVVALCVDGLASSDQDGGTNSNAKAGDLAKQTVSRLSLPFTCGLATRDTVMKLQLVHNYLFDAHRDLPIPTSILIDGNGRLAAFYMGRTSLETLIDDVHNLDKNSKRPLPFAGKWLHERRGMSPFEFVRSLVEHDLLDDASAYVDRNKRLLQNDPEFPKLLSHLGAELLTQGKPEAVRRYQEALDQSGTDRSGTDQSGTDQSGTGAEHHYNLGLAKQSQGDVHGAILEYKQALALDADNFRAHNNLAAALASQGKLDQAVLHFRHVVRIDPKYAQGRFNLANALIGLGKIPPAIEQLREAIKLEPGYAKAHNNLAVALHRIGRTEEARKHLQEAKRLSGAK